ncbi:MAG: MATE family efflux transporter [Myxococcales bacterium]|nr:MATE family efflux transporter [Myxococcales bacterium]
MSSQSTVAASRAPALPSARGELSALLSLAAPIALAQAGQALMGVVATAIVGRAGAAAQAGVGLGNGLFFTVAAFAIGLMLGLDPLISQAFGAAQARRARELLWQGGWMALFTSAAMLLPLSLIPLGLGAAGIEAEVAHEASRYLFWRLPGLLPLLCFVAARGYLQAAARPLSLVLATVIANLANAGAGVLLVFGGGALPAWAGPLCRIPAMGAAGAALATSFAAALQLVIAVLAVGKAPKGEAPVLRRAVAADLLAAARVGLPVGLQMAAEVGVFALVGLLAGRLGKESLAAHQVALTYASFTFCLALGVGNAGSVRVGWAIGARDTPAARRSGLWAVGGGVGMMSLSAAAFLLIPGPLAALMTGASEVQAIAVRLLAVSAVLQISDGVQGVAAGILRGAGDTRVTFWANVAGHYAFGLPVGVLLGLKLGLGVVGLWWGLSAGLSAVAVGLLARFLWLTSREVAPLSVPSPASGGGD